MQYDVTVIGAGPGGYVCAIRAAQLGFKMALIEEGTVGGVCLNWGCIPTKALYSATKLVAKAKQAGAMGIEFPSPQIDLSQLAAWKQGIVSRLVGGIEALLKSNDVTLIEGKGRLDGAQRVVLSTGDTIESERVVLATGSSPMEIPGFGFSDPNVWSSDDALLLAEIPDRLLVIGGGVIGLELATIYNRLGSEVTVIEMMPEILPGIDLDRRGLTLVKRALTAHGIALHVNTAASSVDGSGGGVVVQTSGERTFEADRVLVAVGRHPNSEGIGLETVGIEPDRRGFIPVDETLQTTAAGVYAIGDLIGGPMLAHKASAEGVKLAAFFAGETIALDADYMLVVARTDEKSKGDAGITIFIVDAKSPGISYTVLKTMANDKLCEVVFHQVSVPKENILGQLHQGWSEVQKIVQQAAVAKCCEIVGCIQQVSSVYDHIRRVNPHINAYITLTEERARESARKIDDRRKKGENLRALAGLPIAVKDNICTRGIRTTCASKILSDFIPPYDATAVERLKTADAVVIGKTNMDEFAMGSSNETSFFGLVQNPFDSERIPGGSSGGSAAAVASHMATMALGSDTGGSVRQPAGLCGVVGMKPTYGRISRYGLVAFASSLDQIGVIAKDVRDCTLLSSVVCGHDPKDSTSLDQAKPNFYESLDGEIKYTKLGIPREYFGEGLEEEVEKAVLNGVRILENLGMKVEEVSLPHADKAIATYYVLADAEASSNLARYDGVRYGHRAEGELELSQMYEKTRSEGFGAEVKRRIILGTYVLSAGYYEAYYAKAQKVRTIIKEDFDRAFEKVDVIVTPTSPTTAFKIGEKMDDPLTMYLSDVYTVSANLAGIPAISVPCGKDSKGLPIGLQIMGRPLSESLILNVAYALQQNL